MRLPFFAWSAFVLLLPSVGLTQTITLGQVDTFETGSLANWQQGFNSPPDAVLLKPGGPTGSTQYMQVTASGDFGAGSKLTVFNQSQWLGNYIAAGVNAVEMDLFAPTSNPQTLSMRIAYKANSGAGSPGYSSTTAFSLPADGQWHHAVFLLSNSTMTPIGSPTSPFSTFITSPGEMRILHSVSPSLNGDTITAVVGVDNIRASAVPVPEPVGVLLVAGAGVGLVVLRRRVRRAVVVDGA